MLWTTRRRLPVKPCLADAAVKNVAIGFYFEMCSEPWNVAEIDTVFTGAAELHLNLESLSCQQEITDMYVLSHEF